MLKTVENGNNSEIRKFHYSALSFYPPPSSFRYNWPTTLCQLKMYNVMIWYIPITSHNCPCVYMKTFKIYSLSFQEYIIVNYSHHTVQ